jgi:hypothetical protein
VVRVRAVSAFAVALLFVLSSATPAFAGAHGTGWWDPWPGSMEECVICHNDGFINDPKTGPHDNYTTGTNKCQLCHTIHDAISSYKLLPAFTIQDTCEMCHDGTGGSGVFGAIESRGLEVGASHRVETTTIIPGGDAATGGSRTETFTGSVGTLTCGDCHSPHNSNTVEPFRGERIRFHADELNYGAPDRHGGRPSYCANAQPGLRRRSPSMDQTGAPVATEAVHPVARCTITRSTRSSPPVRRSTTTAWPW